MRSPGAKVRTARSHVCVLGDVGSRPSPRRTTRPHGTFPSPSRALPDAVVAQPQGGAPEPVGTAVARAAFLDVDGTITATNVVMAFATCRLAELPPWAKPLWVPAFAARGLLYLALDRVDRSLFNRVFYKSYRGRPAAGKHEMAALVHEKYLQPRAFAGALEHIRQLKREGFRIVLVTGSLDFLVAPLAREVGADAVYAARLVEKDGRFTGELASMAVSNAEKGALVAAYAAEHRVSLADCHAYGDSIADLAMLEAVGYPHAVKPDSRLRAIALERGWPVLQWD